MADIAELKQYVEGHPGDHEKRWWLAKRLYKAGDYAAALEHLVYLKAQWDPKLNVRRYLAATYYRLARFPEAVMELQEAIGLWPDDIPVREQLARVLEVSGRTDAAGEVWVGILDLQPNHPVAREALDQLQSGVRPAPGEPSGALQDRVLGVGSGTGVVCPNCGALNTEDLAHCAFCDARLLPGTKRPRARARASLARRGPSRWLQAVGYALPGILAVLALFLTVRYGVEQPGDAGDPELVRSVHDVFMRVLLPGRVAVCGALIIAWPLLLAVVLRLVKADSVSARRLLLWGGTGALLFYLATWLPVVFVYWAAPGLLLLSCVPFFLLRMSIPRTFAAWGLQAAGVVAMAAAVFAAVDGPPGLADLAATYRYARAHDVALDRGRHVFRVERVPASCRLQWESTGSPWLDRHAGDIAMVLYLGAEPSPLTVEFADATGPLAREQTESSCYVLGYRVVPGRPYELRLTAIREEPLDIVLYSVLRPRIETEPVSPPGPGSGLM